MDHKKAFNNKNVIITGSNRGIGFATLNKFAEQGANIWACIRKEDTVFEEKMLRLALEYGVWIKTVPFDLSDEGSVRAGIKKIIDDKQPIDVLVNNAGIPYGGLFIMTPIAKLREVFEINFFMQILVMQLVAKKMIRQKEGVIINLASVGGIETNPGYLAYGSSKAAIIWATQSIAKELAPYHIRVNAVAPGLTNTEMGHFKSSEAISEVISRTGLKRMAQPEEIADAILFLASDSASYITGQILRADGGR